MKYSHNPTVIASVIQKEFEKRGISEELVIRAHVANAINKIDLGAGLSGCGHPALLVCANKSDRHLRVHVHYTNEYIITYDACDFNRNNKDYVVSTNNGLNDFVKFYKSKCKVKGRSGIATI